MSRCFPYPPPGYESLIESIKLGKEKERTKKERRKEKKREKKDKKEKKREENRKLDHTEFSHEKREYGERSQSKQKDGYRTETREDEIEQLEKSSLTEENKLPASIQNHCDSSDSTQNSGKKKKPLATDSIHNNHGTGLRIRLPLLKRKDPEPPASIEEPCCSGRVETAAGGEETEIARSQFNVERSSSSTHKMELKLRGSGRVETAAGGEETEIARSQFNVERSSSSTHKMELKLRGSGRVETAAGGEVTEITHSQFNVERSSSSTHKMELKLRDLMLNWNPPPVQMEHHSDIDDQEWLFEKKHHQHAKPNAKRCKVSGEELGHGNVAGSWQARACHLPEVDIYALPYVIPY